MLEERTEFMKLLTRKRAKELESRPGIVLISTNKVLKGGAHGSAHVHESKYFFAFPRYDSSRPVNLIRCL